MGNSMNVGCDPEMLDLFRAEMDTHLPVLSRGLLALEKGEVTAQEIEAMMRAAHSIKGAARIVGIEPAVRVSHIMEDCFTAAKETAKEKCIALNSVAVDVLLEGLDALQRICSPQDGEAVSEASLQTLLGRIAAVRDASPAAAAASPPPPAPKPALSGNLVAATVDRDEPGITLPAAWNDESAAALRREMLDTLSLRPARIRLDFAHVERLCASALAVLASFAREAGQCKPSPAVRATETSDSVRSVLRLGGLGGDLGLDLPV
jgi:chemotaxis protein histidine kinase CheA